MQQQTPKKCFILLTLASLSQLKNALLQSNLLYEKKLCSDIHSNIDNRF